MADSETEQDGPVTVAVIEGHPAFRYALEQVIARNHRLRLVGSFPTGESGLIGVRASQPGVVTVDIELPGLDGIAVLRSLTTCKATRALVISAHADGVTVQRALAAGACGYLSKSAEVEEIERALLATAEGRAVLHPLVQQALAERLRFGSTNGAAALSDREREVLQLAASGDTRGEIGRRLYVSEATVKAHLASAYKKLGVRTRAAAVTEAQRRGVIRV